MITVDTVAKRYGDQIVLDDVTLRIADRGITALVGPNGAGKSTLLSVISRLLRPEGGVVKVDDLDVSRTRSKELAKRLAILRQDNHLAVRLTVRDLVTFGRYPHSGGRLGPDDRAAIDEALRYLDLVPLADRYLDEVSGGQRQRAFVAMVLAQDTDYVLLDEPLNNLDMAHSVAMMDLLRRAADELGKTIVIVLHDINVAASYADELVAMRDGAVVLSGPPCDVMNPESLRSVFGVLCAVHEIGGHRVCLPYRMGVPLC